MQEKIKGTLLLIVGGSGVGKGSILKALKEDKSLGIFFPVSSTTRQPRPGEKNGETYFFLTEEEFKQKIDQDDFLEWAFVHQKAYYGTDKQSIIQSLKEGKTVVREIDFQGYESIKKILPKDNLKIAFVSAGDWETLKNRITSRSPITDEELQKRKASFEIEQAYEQKADFVIHNLDGKLEQAIQQTKEIIKSLNS